MLWALEYSVFQASHFFKLASLYSQALVVRGKSHVTRTTLVEMPTTVSLMMGSWDHMAFSWASSNLVMYSRTLAKSV